MTRIGPRICLKVPCVQIWAKKVQKEVSQVANRNFAARYAIRWLKCKFKPPKNWQLIAKQTAQKGYFQKAKIGYIEHPRLHRSMDWFLIQ